jgi:hypothetical protein
VFRPCTKVFAAVFVRVFAEVFVRVFAEVFVRVSSFAGYTEEEGGVCSQVQALVFVRQGRVLQSGASSCGVSQSTREIVEGRQVFESVSVALFVRASQSARRFKVLRFVAGFVECSQI